MTTKNTTSANVVNNTTISDDVAERIQDAFNAFVHLASTHLGVTFPEGASNADKWDKAVGAAYKAHAVYRRAKKEEQVRQFRKGCEEVIAFARGEARKAKSEYDALSPALKALMPKFPTNVEVPVSDFADIFPQGTKVERMAVLLKDMSYKLVKSATGLCVSVALFPEEQKSSKVA